LNFRLSNGAIVTAAVMGERGG